MAIDYQKIANSVDYYAGKGFTLIELPWTVSKQVMEITASQQDTADNFFPFHNEYLVASAEQSFLSQIENNKLKYGRYCATSPCFRNDVLDDLHHAYFMKTELIQFKKHCKTSDLLEMVKIAKTFFDMYLDDVIIVETKDPNSLESFDLESNGIELGSYGIRTHNDYMWVYGTGCAEPRLSFCLGS